MIKDVDTISTENSVSNKNEKLDIRKRLYSSGNWNKSIPITSTDSGDAVNCSIDQHNWEGNADVYEEQTRFSPKHQILESPMKMDLKYEQIQQKGFAKASTLLPLKAKDFAANGCCYTGPADKACCSSQKCEISNWKDNDDIKEKHRSISPNCPISYQSNKYGSPKHPHFASLSERLKTFSSWPKYKNQKPESLADAGFFHNGKADIVTCFSCDGGLCNWKDDDIPWEEHIRWFPKCTFVHQMKESKNNGNEKVMDAALQIQTESFETDTSASKNMKDNIIVSDTSASAFQKSKLSFMESPTVLAVLSMGYKRNLVKRIVKNKIKETGSFFSQASDLLEAIENDPHFDNNDDVEEVSDEEVPDQTREKHDTKMSSTTSADLIAENNMLKEQKLCKICFDEELSVVFLPCGHLISCASCASTFSTCPLCRKNILGMMKIYF